MLGPAGAGHAGLDQLQGGALGLGRLPGGAETGDAGQQGQRRRAALLARVVDQSLADQLLDGGRARPPPRWPHQVPSSSLTMSSASSGLRTASSSRAARSSLGEERVGRRRVTPALAAP